MIFTIEYDCGTAWEKLTTLGTASSIMTNITTDIANVADKAVNDVTTAAEAALPVLHKRALIWRYNTLFKHYSPLCKSTQHQQTVFINVFKAKKKEVE